MRTLIVDALRIVAPLCVALIVFAAALEVAPGRIAALFRDRPLLLLRSLTAALVLVPLAALGIILVLDPAPAIAIALAILVSCPPAPLMIKNAPKMGHGDSAYVASLHLSLAALAIVTVPVLLEALAIPLGFSSSAGVDSSALLAIVARTMLLPIGLGMAVRVLFPSWADRFGGLLGKIGTLGLAVVVLAVLGALYPALFAMDAASYGVIAAVCVTALAIGHLAGPPNADEKTVLAIECAVRHPALAISIASANFTQEQALPVLAPCVLTFVAIATAYLFWRGRSALGARKSSAGASAESRRSQSD